MNTDPTRVIIDAVLQGYSLGDVEANMADKMNVTVDGITYILARFSDGMQKEVGLPAVADAVSGSAPKA